MDRRSFLSLLVATPLIPVVERAVVERARAAVPAPLLERAVAVERVARRARLRTYVLPFGADAGFADVVLPGRVVRYMAMPQMIFRPRNLLVASVDAPWFEVLNVSASGEPQLDEAVSATVFSEFSAATFAFDAVPPGQCVVLAVRNIGREARRFHAAMVGEVAVGVGFGRALPVESSVGLSRFEAFATEYCSCGGDIDALTDDAHADGCPNRPSLRDGENES